MNDILIVIIIISLVGRLISIASSSRKTKYIPQKDFIKMMAHLNIDLVVIENAGWFGNTVSFVYKGWKFTTTINAKYVFPPHINVVG